MGCIMKLKCYSLCSFGVSSWAWVCGLLLGLYSLDFLFADFMLSFCSVLVLMLENGILMKDAHINCLVIFLNEWRRSSTLFIGGFSWVVIWFFSFQVRISVLFLVSVMDWSSLLGNWFILPWDLNCWSDGD